MDSSEKTVVINENSNSDFTTNLENKIIENTDTSSALHVCIYSYMGFFDRESLVDYINDILEDEEITIDDIEDFPRFDDSIYILASNETLALIVKEWFEGFYQIYDAKIVESLDAIPPEEKHEPVVVKNEYVVDPKDLTCNSYILIAHMDEDENEELKDSIAEFMENHRVILVDAYEDNTYVQNNIAVIVGNNSHHYAVIEEDLKKLNYTTTQLLINFTITTNVPEIYKDAKAYVDNYIKTRYGSKGIEVHINIVDECSNCKDYANFRIDIQSNIPTTIVHSDIMAYLGSYCLAVEFAYNKNNGTGTN